jgi:4-amino-4-deoxy-L-arabinose transferase-like glycosyltransferase
MSASRPRSGLPRRWFVSVVALLFVVFALELYLSVRLESQTFDEPAHMYAGYGYWLHSDFGVNPEHPPLVKLVATLPLLVDRPKYPDPPELFFRFQSAAGGMIMMSAPDAQRILAHVRAAVSVFVLVLGLLAALAAREMFGDGAALVALLLFVFDPVILAHGPLLGTDMGATCCIFAAVYAFYRFVKRPTAMRLAVCGVATGLAFAAKHSAILIFPILALLCVFELLFVRGEGVEQKPALPDRRRALRMMGAYAVIVVAAIAVLWAFYGFRYAARPGGKQIIPPANVYLKALHHPFEAGVIGFAERHRILPESYLYGLTDVTILARDGRPTYLFGMLYPQGRWFYFPAAFVIKMTIGLLGLLALTPFARALWRKEKRREVVFLVLPVVIFFGMAMTAKVDIGIRHILPIMPFLIVLAAGTATALATQSRKWAWAAGILVALHVVESVHAFPNYLPFSNMAFGGPSRTYRVLHDSNVGWSGGLKALHAYLQKQNITQCWFAYSAPADPQSFQIPCKTLPTYFSSVTDRGRQQPVPTHIDGPIFISSEEPTGWFTGPGALNPYDQFKKLTPSHVIAGEILEFDGSYDIPQIAGTSEWVVAVGLLRQHKMDEAAAHAEEAVALDPQSIIAHEVLAAIDAARHQNDGAEHEYQAALNLYRGIDPAYAAMAGSEPQDPLAKR